MWIRTCLVKVTFVRIVYQRYHIYMVSHQYECGNASLSDNCVQKLFHTGDIDISTVDVTNKFKKSKANKAPGPDGIPGRLLSVQLS